MVQPSKRFDIWRRLYTRFLIEPVPVSFSEQPGIGTIIQPITSADELLKIPQTLTGDSQDLQAAAGTFTVYHTVPAGKRWKVTVITRGATQANSRVRFRSKPGDDIMTISALATALLPIFLNVQLEEAGTIGMDTTGNAGDDAVFLSVYLEEEDAF